MDREQQMAALIEEYHQSGQSLKTFCLQNQISYHTFQYWRYRKKRLSNKHGAFIAVHANPHPLQLPFQGNDGYIRELISFALFEKFIFFLRKFLS